MNKKILLLILLAVLVAPSVILAQGGGITIASMVESITQKVWIVAAAIVVLLWLVTGVLFLAAQGTPEKLKTAKTALFTSIAGTIIVILAYSAMALVSDLIGA